MKQTAEFSIVMPTYSGVETIDKAFESIHNQRCSSRYEVIVVIDGPNDQLLKICNKHKQKFEESGHHVTIKQFKKNKGRFIARIEGAKLSSTGRILFMDDRIELGDNYLRTLINKKANIAMPTVIEKGNSNRPVSIAFRNIRKKLYGITPEKKFDDFYITKETFEQFPKGTAALWVGKDTFLRACNKISNNNEKLNKHVNEDTKVLRAIVQEGGRILRCSSLIIHYRPRSDFKSERTHLYGRGPRFVDYYLKRGTRFFYPLVAFYLILIAIMVALIAKPFILVYFFLAGLIFMLLLSLYISDFKSESIKSFIGLLVIMSYFGAGLIKGLFVKLAKAD